MNNKHKHLEFIQAAVGRMAGNLFLLKGWTITLIAALFALAQKDSENVYFVIAYVGALMFWALDGYFLAQERCFRALYDDVRMRSESQIDFSMDTSPYKKVFRNRWLGGLISRTLTVYYGVLLFTMAVVALWIRK